MGEYFFGITQTKPTRTDARRIERIARRCDATWIEAKLPGTGYQAWFACQNLGHPFDRAVEEAVLGEIESVGISYILHGTRR